MKSLNSNVKILITVLVFAVVLAVLVCVLKFAGGNSNQDEAETTTSRYGYVEEDSEEATSSMPITTSPAMNMNSNVSDAVSAAIVAYMSGQYYIDGVMYSDGTATEMQVAISGKDFQTSADVEGMKVSVLYKSGNIYFINEDTKQYILLTDVLMDQVDVDLSEMEQLTEYLNLTQYNFTEFEQYTGTVNGYNCDCYKYYNDEMSVIFYFIGDELKQVDMQVDMGDSNGNVSSSITVNDFSPEVPAGTMSLSGLTKTTLIGFFGSSLY